MDKHQATSEEQYYSDTWIQRLEEKAHKLVELKKDSHANPVRIAILDSGLDGTHIFFHDRRKRIKAFKDWIRDDVDVTSAAGLSKALLSSKCVDKTGHGTHLTSLLLTTAPFADVYAGRVVDTDAPREDLVAKVGAEKLRVQCLY